MEHTIKNDIFTVKVAEEGAELLSIMHRDGLEYLWQGDKQYWPDRAPVLFPFIGRLTHNSYRCHGKEYPMGIHGFAAQSHFTLAEKSEGHVVLELHSNQQTLAQYPFSFLLRITYRLEKNSLQVCYEVQNLSGETMPFAIGGHPGFRVPLLESEKFEDYMLEFSQYCQPDRVGFTPMVYLSGCDEAYPLEDGRRISLHHSLFDEDAIILKNMDRKVTLRSEKSGHGVTVAYPGMPYLGIWHMPKTCAPYVCIEPWTSLPARQDIIEEFTCKSDMIQLEAGCSYTNQWNVSMF